MIKVACYCRVSTSHEDQANSFEAQQRYFREHIRHRSDWELFDVYADEGITGTSVQKRHHFQRMMADAQRGCFQLILTKEVSRFSRNILDTIGCTRTLKELGIGVQFLTDGFNSLDPDAELRLSIMGSIAQEESRKTSLRVKWGQSRQMERGVVFGTSLLGYRVYRGQLRIDPEGAQLVKEIFFKYAVEKKSTTMIAQELTKNGILTPQGNSYWHPSVILRILKNEKYVGDLIQKKTYTPNYLTHRKKTNHGEESFIILTDHHEPIIGRELWELTQLEIKNRARKQMPDTQPSKAFPLSGKIRCGICGNHFIARTKTQKDKTSYRRWICYGACRGRCNIGKTLRDDLALEIVQRAISQISLDHVSITEQLISTLDAIGKNKHPDPRINDIQKKQLRSVDAYLAGIITQQEFEQIRHRYATELHNLSSRYPETSSLTDLTLIRKRIQSLIACQSLCPTYLGAMLEKMTVTKDGMVEVKLVQHPIVHRFQLRYGCPFE